MVGAAKNGGWRFWNDKLQNSQPECLRLVWDFQNCLQSFSSSDIKEVADLLLLTAGAAKNGGWRLWNDKH